MRSRRFPHIHVLALTTLALLLAGCASGPIKRVSEPTASIQQLSVGADGQWTVDLRLQNFSNVPMRFDQVALKLRTGDEAAGELKLRPRSPSARNRSTPCRSSSPPAHPHGC